MKTLIWIAALLLSSIAVADVPENWNGKLLRGEPPTDFETNMPPLMGTKGTFHGKPLSAAPVTQDILILYTKAALTKHTQAGIDKLAQKVVDDANAAYVASKVNVTLRLVDKGLAPVVESGAGTCNTLKTFRDNRAVQDWRNRTKADFAMLLSLDSGSYIGCASLYIINGNVDAFDVTKTSAVAGRTGAHEIGHLQGLDHNFENTTMTPAFPWGHGYRLCHEPEAFRDIMSYPCGGGVTAPRQNFFGTPSLSFNGFPTGTSQADPAQALNDNAAYVATYR